MKTMVVPRRQVLRGAGGFTLALPLLPSLLSRAYGDPVVAQPRRFIAITTNHGGVKRESMFPPESTLTNTREIVPGHTARWGRLARRIEGGDAVLSPVLRGPAATLSERLVGKMNVLQGVDITFRIGHHSGGHLGNYANCFDSNFRLENLPTIDQLMAWSPSFYPDLGGIKERFVATGTNYSATQVSWTWSNPQARAGTIQPSESLEKPSALFARLFAPPGNPRQRSVVDHVLDSYKTMRDGNRRLSARDRQRLTDHMDHLSELQRRVTVIPKCSGPQGSLAAADQAGTWPAGREGQGAKRPEALVYHRAILDIIHAALVCDLTRVVVIAVGHKFSDFLGDWHTEVAHLAHSQEAAQELTVAKHRDLFNNVFLPLAEKLDAAEPSGATMLDHSLLVWTQESGMWTHDSDSTPIVVAGGAGGFLKTGHYVDYRNLVPGSRLIESWGQHYPGRYAGVSYNRYLATCLAGMGVPEREWKRNGTHGYGLGLVAGRYVGRYLPGVLESASLPLPIIT